MRWNEKGCGKIGVKTADLCKRGSWVDFCRRSEAETTCLQAGVTEGNVNVLV